MTVFNGNVLTESVIMLLNLSAFQTTKGVRKVNHFFVVLCACCT